VTRNAISPSKSARALSICLLLLGGAALNGGVLVAIRSPQGAPQQSQPAPVPTAPQSPGEGRRGFGQDGSGRGGPAGQDVRPWWKDPAMAREVGLTQAQIARIDRLYELRQKQIQPKADEYNRQKEELDRMMRERTAKPSEVEEQARRWTYPHLDIDVSRLKLLYEISLVMTPEQNSKMRAMFDRERAGRGRGGNAPHH
jgi:Spy/CpxP family protein refolding chaperone